MTYGVVIPSMLTFFNLWATTKGAKVRWNIISAFTVTSFAGSIGAGVTGISNATVAFDAIVHNTLWVVGHFHTMILFGIVPAAMALIYFTIPLIAGRNWFSSFLAWFHFWGYIIGAGIMVVFFDQLGLIGILRRTEIYPRIPIVINSEVMLTIGAFIASISTLSWFINLVFTLLRGRPVKLEGLGIGKVIERVALSLEPVQLPPGLLRGISTNSLFLAIGVILLISGILVLFFSVEITWIILLTIGAFLITYFALRLVKGV